MSVDRLAGSVARAALPVLILAVCAATTAQRLRVWQSELMLWADAAAKAPTKPRPVMDYGRALEMSGDFAGAERQYRATISLTFDDVHRGRQANRFALAAAETNVAHIMLRTGRAQSAVDVLNGTLSWWPEFAYAHYNLGRVLWDIGQCEEAQSRIDFARTQDTALSLPNDPCVPTVLP